MKGAKPNHNSNRSIAQQLRSTAQAIDHGRSDQALRLLAGIVICHFPQLTCLSPELRDQLTTLKGQR